MLTRENWLARHPYLRPLANLDESAQRVVASSVVTSPALVSFESYRAEYLAGIPLLHSAALSLDSEELNTFIQELLLNLSLQSELGDFASRCGDLHSQL